MANAVQPTGQSMDIFWPRVIGACGGKDDGQIAENASDNSTESPMMNTSQQNNPILPESTVLEETGGEKKILIACFSAANNTENIANYLEEILDADLYEIVPETPYTSDDLKYNDNSSRANREQSDSTVRPAISGSVETWSSTR